MVRRKNSPLYDSFLLCRNSIRKDLSHIAHKRRNTRFNGLWWVNTPPQPLNAHTAAHRANGAGKRRASLCGIFESKKTVQNAFKFGTEKNRRSRITADELRLPAKGGLTQFIGAAGPQARVAPLLYLSSHRWVSMVSFSCDNKAQRKASLFSHAGLFHASCHSLSFRCSVHSIHLPLIKLVDGKLDRQDRVE